ncbi:TRAP transporter small permease subunit [Neotabrizicola sp. VNH66]|uniref:TRAP transporter small permease subunit n=1 Tax=Neotabrizicola sp. VNH66 TaxID=3400918 RepID=UPI003C05E325
MSSSHSTRFRRTIAAIDSLTELGGILGALCLLGILALIAAELISRNIFAYSLHFSWDLAGYLMGGCFLLASASALKGGSHVRVTALVEVLPRAVSRRLDLFACLLGLAICGYLAWALIEMAWLSGQRGSTAATSFRVPLVYPQGALALGAAILTLQCLAQVLRQLRGEAMATGPGLD